MMRRRRTMMRRRMVKARSKARVVTRHREIRVNVIENVLQCVWSSTSLCCVLQVLQVCVVLCILHIVTVRLQSQPNVRIRL